MSTRYGMAAMITALAVILVAQLADPGHGGGGYLEVTLLLSLLIMMMSASRFVKWHWGSVAGTSRPNDEFEKQVLARAGATAHAVMLWLTAAVFAWLVVAAWMGLRLPGAPGEWATLGLSVLGIGLALPPLLAEQKSPTDEGEKDQDAST